jgi:hypothetical protein
MEGDEAKLRDKFVGLINEKKQLPERPLALQVL